MCGHWFTIYHDIIKNELLGNFTKSFNIRNAFMFLVLQIPAFHVPGFTDSGFSCSWFYRFRLFMFLVLQIPAFHVPGFTDSGFSCSWFYRFRLFMFLVFSFLVPFLVPFPDSPFLVLQIALRKFVLDDLKLTVRLTGRWTSPGGEVNRQFA